MMCFIPSLADMRRKINRIKERRETAKGRKSLTVMRETCEEEK